MRPPAGNLVHLAASYREERAVTYQEDRAAAIGAIRGLATWLETHPDAPAPNLIRADYYVGEKDEPNEAIRIAGVIGTANRIDAKLSEGEHAVTAAVSVNDWPSVQYRIFGMKDRLQTSYLGGGK